MKSLSPIFTLFTVIVLTANTCFAIPGILSSAVHPTSGHSYLLLENSNWVDAETAAISLGGHLVTVNDEAENNWVFSLWGSNRSLWIGYNDAVVENSFAWSSAEVSTFTKWRAATLEPNDGVGYHGETEDYAYIMASGFSELPGQWNDYLNASIIGDAQPLLHGVVEIVPEPTPAILLALGYGLWLLKSKSHSRRP